MVKILVVGGDGKIGSAIVKEFEGQDVQIIVASRKGKVSVDIEDEKSIHEMYKQVGPVDHVICTAGRAHFGPLESLTADQVMIGAKSKFAGQVNLVLIGLKHINAGGSFTLTTGYLDAIGIKFGAAAGPANAAVHAFVRSACLELKNGVRLNAVCPGLVQESIPEYGSFFQGFGAVPAADVAKVYRRSVYGGVNGVVLRVLPAINFIQD